MAKTSTLFKVFAKGKWESGVKTNIYTKEGIYYMAKVAMHMQKKNLNTPDKVEVYGLIKKENVYLDGVEVHRVTFEKGAKWSKDLKPYAGTKSCLLPHVAYVQSGRLKVVMDDGSEEEFGPGDIMMLPPGHDAWTVGDEACVFIEFSAGTNYYTD
jgi:quercetin dioxygenase-like cupin family protein